MDKQRLQARQERRRDQILDATFAVLKKRGYRGASMLAIAGRARVSKATLYDWYGDKRGLFEALIRRNARVVDEELRRSLVEPREPAAALGGFCRALLALLMGEGAVAINRAAIAEASADPEFGRLLVAAGRNTSLPKLAEYLEAQERAGTLQPGTSAEVLIGLLLGDAQVRRLLGAMPAPDSAWIEARVERAVALFLKLYGTKGAVALQPSSAEDLT